MSKADLFHDHGCVSRRIHKVIHFDFHDGDHARLVISLVLHQARQVLTSDSVDVSETLREGGNGHVILRDGEDMFCGHVRFTLSREEGGAQLTVATRCLSLLFLATRRHAFAHDGDLTNQGP